MTVVTVKVQGVTKLKRALDGDFRKALRTATMGVGSEVKNYIQKYPESSEANLRNHRWYERGFGPKWRSNPARRPKKRRSTRPIVYGPDWAGYNTSETLSRRWYRQQKGLGAIVGNTATYAPAVHHYKEQMRKHGQRGWRTDKQAVDFVVKSGAVDRIVKMAVRKVLGGK